MSADQPAGMFDIAAEQAALGALLASPDVLPDVVAALKPGAFYRPIHDTIYRAILALDARGEPHDPIAVAVALGPKDLARIGGADYLHTLMAAPPSVASGPYYARLVADQHKMRRLAEVSTKLQHRLATADGTSATDLMTEIYGWLSDVEADLVPEGGPVSWDDMVPGVIASLEKAEKAAAEGQVAGLPTGLADLDHLVGGFEPGWLVVIAGRPGMGKTVGAMQIAQHAAWQLSEPTLVFSLEMNNTELGKRLVAAASRTPLQAMKQGKLQDADWARINNTLAAAHGKPLYVEDTANLTLADIRARARACQRKHGLSLVVVDYLQLMETAKSNNRQQEVAAMSRGLKLLAKELNVPVIAVSQLNRGSEQRSNKRPTMADLRESGAIENDSDLIILIHRDDYYDSECPRAGEADWIVDKNRHGPEDTIVLASQLHYSRFATMSLDQEPAR